MKNLVLSAIIVVFGALVVYGQSDTRPPIRDPDRWDTSDWKDEQHRVDILIIALSNSKKDGLLDLTFAKTTSISKRVGRIRRIRHRFVQRKFPLDRILLKISEASKEQTVFWLLGEGDDWLKKVEDNQTLINLSEFEKKKKAVFSKQPSQKSRISKVKTIPNTL